MVWRIVRLEVAGIYEMCNVLDALRRGLEDRASAKP